MRKRAFAGITVVLGIVMATLFNSGLPGFGTRNGSADENEAASEAVVSTETESVSEPSQEAEETKQADADQESQQEPQPKPELKVLDILVDGHNYQVSIRGKGYTTFPLNRIIEVASATTGNEDGIRVRILRRDSARVVAWSRLYEALENAGISKDAILMPHELYRGE